MKTEEGNDHRPAARWVAKARARLFLFGDKGNVAIYLFIYLFIYFLHIIDF